MPNVTIEQGDAFDLLDKLSDNYADVAVVDYPWQFDHKNGSGRYESASAENREERGKRVSDIFDMEPDSRVCEILDTLHRVLRPGSWVLFPADDRFQDVLRESITTSELVLRRNWAWTPGSMGMGYYGRVSHYPIVTATVGETDRYVTGRGTLYECKNGRDTDYPTGKPPSLYQKLLEDPVSKKGDRLLEPFCGSAPGLAASKSLGLDYWGCDVATDAIDHAEHRREQQALADW